MSTTTAAQILAVLGPSCRDSARRARLLGQAVQNGIDFVEFETVAGVHTLHVHFLLALPLGAYGLPADPSPLRVHGGTRIVGVAVTGAAASGADPKVLDVTVDQQGDYSPYLLSIGWKRDGGGVWQDPDGVFREHPASWSFDFPGIDRQFSVAPINFRPGCPVDFDCATQCECPPDVLPEPQLDYLARDYASFRQLLIDFVAQRNPAWIESSPADIGIALLELFAYEGDQQSYFQDAVANEMFLDTARQRASAKRHAKLVDYAMHDGRNAWTFVHFEVTSPGSIGPGQQLVTRITRPMRFDRNGAVPVPQPVTPPGTRLNEVTDEDYRTDPALAQVRVFETAATVNVDPRNNRLRIHSWGNEQCCLPRGTRTAHLYAVDAVAGLAVRPPLAVGDYLLLEELLGPQTGAPADADPDHRQVVRIERVSPDPSTTVVGPASDAMRDRLYLATLGADLQPLPVTVPVPLAQMLPLVEVTWRAEDALRFALCVTVKRDAATTIHDISVARANIGLADNGRGVFEEILFSPPRDFVPTFRLRLEQGPLTVQCQPEPGPPGLPFPPVRERPDLVCDVHEDKPGVALRPAIALQTFRTGFPTDDWIPVPDLLSSSEFSHHFVADIDDSGRAVLRFGDGEYGEKPLAVDRVRVWYRVGNGVAGNIGAESLSHIVVPSPLPLLWPTIERIRNPLPAFAGVDPELIEQVRNYAPVAFRAVQLRAVTEADYRDAARKVSGVADAVASFRWTGSWYTVFVGIDPVDSLNVNTDARGFTRLDPLFKQHVHDALTRYRLAGYDLEIRAARYVPLDIAIHICVKAGYFPGDVAHAVAVALGAQARCGGRSGFFDAANFSFGQPVYLSRIYEVVESVDGVESATITEFHRHGRSPGGELANGVLPIGPWEIARLDNDPSNMENGVLTIEAGGGA